MEGSLQPSKKYPKGTILDSNGKPHGQVNQDTPIIFDQSGNAYGENNRPWDSQKNRQNILSKKTEEEIKKDSPESITKLNKLRENVRKLNGEYRSIVQREEKAIKFSELEKAQKELLAFEETLDKQNSSKKQEVATEAVTPAYSATQDQPISVNTPTNEVISKEKKKFKVGFVDTTDVMRNKARDAGDAAMTMEAPQNPDDFKGVKKFFKGEFWKRTGAKIWKHGLWRDYYRNKEVARARERILGDQNIFAAEGREQADHDKFVADVMEQFTSEYEEVIHREAGEVRKQNEEIKNEQEIKTSVKKLIVEYASGRIDREAFKEEESRIFSGLKADTEGRQLRKKEDMMHASNIEAVAEEVRKAMAAGTFLENEDFDIDLIYGKSKGDVRTEAKFTKTEALAEKLSHTKLGQFVNETTMVSALSGITSAGIKLSQSGANMGAKILPFVGSALVGSGFAKIREGKKIEEERRQHAREMAKGETFDPTRMERRREMETSRYETESAENIIRNISQNLEILKTNEATLTPEQLQSAISDFAGVEARIGLSDRRNIDLICYSNTAKVVEERRKLDIERAKIKIQFRKLFETGKFGITNPQNTDTLRNGDFDSYLESFTKTQENILIGRDGTGMDAKDRIFNKMKSKKSWQAARKAFISGLVIGTATQEALALGTDQIGILENTSTNTGNFTALAQLKNLMENGVPPVGGSGILHEAFTGSNIKLPEGTNMIHNPDGSYNLLRGNTAIAEHLTVNPDGTFTPDAENILRGNGINIDNHLISGTVQQNVTPGEYIKNHPGATHEMHRDLWYDENTPMYQDPNNPGRLLGADLNELGTRVSLDANGDYIVNIGHMTSDGSFHEATSADVKQLLIDGKAKVLISLSKETQNQVLEVTPTFNSSGQLVINQNSEIGKIAFANAGGKGIFSGKFLEIGQDMGNNHYNILSTVEGVGVKDILDTIPINTPETILGIPQAISDYNLPPFIPLVPRTPLEKLEKGKLAPTPVYYEGGNLSDIEKEFERRNIRDPYTITTLKDGTKIVLDKEKKEVKRDLNRELVRINSYLAEQPKEYLEELKRFNASLPPMSENCRVAVIIPARFEEMNLANLLDQYVKQVDKKGSPIDKNLFEINILVNRKEGERADRSIEIIEEWKIKNPGYHVNVIDVVLPKEKANVGVARKYITDLSLMRSAGRTQPGGPLYIESEDADLFSIDKRTINTLISGFDEKPYLDVLRGVQDRQPEVMSQNDLLFFERRLWDIGEMRMRALPLRPDRFNKSSFTWNRVISGGWNTAYTAEAYAEIGGYVPDTIGEDMKIGQKISVLRGTKGVPNTYTAETSGLRANSSPRRFIDAMKKQQNPYDNFEDQSMKGKTLEELMKGLKKFERISPEHRKRYEAGINTLYSFMKGEMGAGKETRDTMKHTLFYLGLKENQDYTFTKSDGIEMTDKGYKKIGDSLSQYRDEEKWKLGYRRQNSPLNVEKLKRKKSKKESVNLNYDLMETQIQIFMDRFPNNTEKIDSTNNLLSKGLNDEILRKLGLSITSEELRRQLEECKKIQDKEEFSNKVKKILRPIGSALEKNPKEFIKLQRKLFAEAYGLTPLNEAFSYGINNGDLHLHLAPASDLSKLEKLKLFRSGFKNLREVVNAKQEVKEVSATSWIVESNPSLLKKLGFEIKKVQMKEGAETRTVTRAIISREKFLKIKRFQ